MVVLLLIFVLIMVMVNVVVVGSVNVVSNFVLLVVIFVG